MGLFSAIAGFFGASKKRKAAKQAADAQVAAAQQGIGVIQGNQQQGIDALTGAREAGIASLTAGRDGGLAALANQMGINREDLEKTLADLAPFISGGAEALGAQKNLLGLGGNDAQGSAIAALKNSPLFASLFGAGEEAILANGSATGGLRGGNIQRSLADFGSDTLAKVIEHQLSQLGGVRDAGITAAGQAGNARLGAGQLNSGLAQDQANLNNTTGVNLANLNTGTAGIIANLLGASGVNIANLFGQQGSARAGGIIGKANAESQMFGSALEGLASVIGAFLPVPGVGAAAGGSGGGIMQTIGKII